MTQAKANIGKANIGQLPSGKKSRQAVTFPPAMRTMSHAVVFDSINSDKPQSSRPRRAIKVEWTDVCKAAIHEKVGKKVGRFALASASSADIADQKEALKVARFQSETNESANAVARVSLFAREAEERAVLRKKRNEELRERIQRKLEKQMAERHAIMEEMEKEIEEKEEEKSSETNSEIESTSSESTSSKPSSEELRKEAQQMLEEHVQTNFDSESDDSDSDTSSDCGSDSSDNSSDCESESSSSDCGSESSSLSSTSSSSSSSSSSCSGNGTGDGVESGEEDESADNKNSSLDLSSSETLEITVSALAKAMIATKKLDKQTFAMQKAILEDIKARHFKKMRENCTGSIRGQKRLLKTYNVELLLFLDTVQQVKTLFTRA